MYNESHYSNKLLLAERQTIVKALTRTKGSIRKSHKLLCPKGLYYNYNALIKVIQRHGLKSSDYKNSPTIKKTN